MDRGPDGDADGREARALLSPDPASGRAQAQRRVALAGRGPPHAAPVRRGREILRARRQDATRARLAAVLAAGLVDAALPLDGMLPAGVPRRTLGGGPAGRPRDDGGVALLAKVAPPGWLPPALPDDRGEAAQRRRAGGGDRRGRADPARQAGRRPQGAAVRPGRGPTGCDRLGWALPRGEPPDEGEAGGAPGRGVREMAGLPGELGHDTRSERDRTPVARPGPTGFPRVARVTDGRSEIPLREHPDRLAEPVRGHR